MAYDIRKVKTMTDLIGYFSQNLRWNIDVDDFDDIEDISYDFEAEDIGLKEEAFAKISSLRQLQPLVDGQRWGIFCVEFDSDKFEVTALRKILSGLVPKRRNSADHAVWDQKDLMFICNWGKDNNRTIGIAHFEDKDSGLPQIKMISCAPAMEDTMHLQVFEKQLAQLAWPKNTNNIEAWRESWAAAFVSGYRQAIHDSVTLTVQLAAEAQNIRNRILDILEVESPNGYVHLLYEKFRNTLIHDMTETQFADMYAQTVVYGLFSARCMDQTQGNFSAEEAIDCIPNTNPFLKSLMKECLGSENNTKLSFDELEISNVVELLRNTRIEAIIQDFNRQTGGGREDPVIHFYEEFLTAYDKAQKVQRGVYYTPQPVVNFMVRAVDSIIKEQFGLPDGLASDETKKIKVKRKSYKKRAGQGYKEVEELVDVPAIQVLDPATGTGTFLRQTILQIYENFKAKHKGLRPDQLAAEWNKYVPEQLLPRLNGFELMMAPYAVAHMKLAMVLKDTGYDFSSDSRLKVFLTNSLEEAGSTEEQISIWDDPLALESFEANGTKKNKGINVVIGNPPYLSASTNTSNFITSLMEDYRKEPGGLLRLQERKDWLNDDYVKFLRYSEELITQTNAGIIAFINPHGWLENGGFRGMRWKLMQSFDDIYIVNLHGNSKKGEVCPDGSKDENVFDIQQGVCINIFVKRSNTPKLGKKLATVNYCDLYGMRDTKYNFLLKTSLKDCPWKVLSPDEPKYFLIPRDFSNADTYEKGFRVSEIFRAYSQGVMSGNDAFVMFDTRKEAEDILLGIRNSNNLDSAISLVCQGRKLPKNWSVTKAIEDVCGDASIERIQYRPYDAKYTIYTGRSCGWLWRPRADTMDLLSGSRKNYALIVTRIVQKGSEYRHTFISDCITDKGMLSSKDNAFVFPLYRFGNELGRNARYSNFTEPFLASFSSNLGLPISEDKPEGCTDYISSFDIMAYIYAILHSKNYTSFFREMLITEFPKVPYTSDKNEFWNMVECGNQLISIHLQRKTIQSASVVFVEGNSPSVDKITYTNHRIYINSKCYFDGVSQRIWEYVIGSYQIAEKWLKDRKGTTLTPDEIKHYLMILDAISSTQSIVEKIDSFIEFN